MSQKSNYAMPGVCGMQKPTLLTSGPPKPSVSLEKPTANNRKYRRALKATKRKQGKP